MQTTKRLASKLAVSLMLGTMLTACGVNRHDLGHYEAFMPPTDLSQSTAAHNAAYEQQLLAEREAAAAKAQKRLVRYNRETTTPEGWVDFTTAPRAPEMPVGAAPVSVSEPSDWQPVPEQFADATDAGEQIAFEPVSDTRSPASPDAFFQPVAEVEAPEGLAVIAEGRVRTTNLDEVLRIARFENGRKDRPVNGTLVVSLGTRGLFRVTEFAELVVRTGGRSYTETAQAIGQCWFEHEGLAGVENYGGNAVIDQLNTMTDLAGVKLCLGARGFDGGLNAAPVHPLSGPFVVAAADVAPSAPGLPASEPAMEQLVERSGEDAGAPYWMADRTRNHQSARGAAVATSQPQFAAPPQPQPAVSAQSMPVPPQSAPSVMPQPQPAADNRPVLLRGSNRPIRPTAAAPVPVPVPVPVPAPAPQAAPALGQPGVIAAPQPVIAQPQAQPQAQPMPQSIGRPVAPPPMEVQRAASQPLTPQEVIAARQRAEAEAAARRMNEAIAAQTASGTVAGDAASGTPSDQQFFRAAPSQSAPAAQPQAPAAVPVAEVTGGVTPARAGTPKPVKPVAEPQQPVVVREPVATAVPRGERLPTLEELLSGKVD